MFRDVKSTKYGMPAAGHKHWIAMEGSLRVYHSRNTRKEEERFRKNNERSDKKRKYMFYTNQLLYHVLEKISLERFLWILLNFANVIFVHPFLVAFKYDVPFSRFG